MVSTAHGITHDSGRVFGVEKDLSGLVSELGICILAAVSNADNVRNARMFTTSFLFFIGGNLIRYPPVCCNQKSREKALRPLKLCRDGRCVNQVEAMKPLQKLLVIADVGEIATSESSKLCHGKN